MERVSIMRTQGEYRMKKLLVSTIFVGLLFAIQLAVYADKPEFVTICHATGLAGTDHFVTLTIPYNAVYGQAGHLNENGTTQAGHEEDYVGECISPTIIPTQGITPPVQPTNSIPTPTTVIPSPSIVPTGIQPTGVQPTGIQPTSAPKAGDPLPQGASQPAMQGRGEPEKGIAK